MVTIMEVRNIAVLGTGLMGHGICQIAAQGGYKVGLRDVEQRFLDNGMAMIKKSLQKFQSKGKSTEEQVAETLNRIHPTLDLKEAVSDVDFIVEAAPEKVELKKAIFKEVDTLAPPRAREFEEKAWFLSSFSPEC